MRNKIVCRRSNLVLWFGLAGVMAVWGVCFRLTFWELSWDVMEPITYFIGSGTGKCTAALAICIQQSGQ